MARPPDPVPRRPHWLAAGLLAMLAHHAWAQDVRLVGTIGGSRAIVIVDGGKPRTLATGQGHSGIQLLEVQGNTATFDVGGERQTLTVGQAPTRVASATSRLQLGADAGGHYFADGQINGQPVRFMVDTGASTVAMDAQTAARLGIDVARARPVRIATANGQTQGWTVQLREVRVGSLSQRDIAATVTQETMPFVLLGNSFLNHYHMTRDASAMVLQAR